MSEKSDAKIERRLRIETRGETRDRRLKSIAIAIIDRTRGALASAFPEEEDRVRQGRIVVDFPSPGRPGTMVLRRDAKFRLRLWTRRPGLPCLFVVANRAACLVPLVTRALEWDAKNRRAGSPGKDPK